MDSIIFSLEQIVLDGWTSDDGELMTSAVLKPSLAATPKSKGLTGANRIALDALTHAIATLCKEPDLRKRMGEASRARVAEWDWTRAARLFWEGSEE